MELWRLRALLRGRRFDLLLDMQLSLSREPDQPPGPCPHQARLRSAACARAAMAVHECADRPLRLRSTCWTHSWASHVPAASSLEPRIGTCRLPPQLRSTMRVASSSTIARRCSSAPAPAMRPAIGRPRDTPRSPITPRSCIRCGWCWSAAAAPLEAQMGDAIAAAARAPQS